MLCVLDGLLVPIVLRSVHNGLAFPSPVALRQSLASASREAENGHLAHYSHHPISNRRIGRDRGYLRHY